nr:hypothetical protein [Streptomyces sp. GS7]
MALSGDDLHNQPNATPRYGFTRQASAKGSPDLDVQPRTLRLVETVDSRRDRVHRGRLHRGRFLPGRFLPPCAIRSDALRTAAFDEGREAGENGIAGEPPAAMVDEKEPAFLVNGQQ